METAFWICYLGFFFLVFIGMVTIAFKGVALFFNACKVMSRKARDEGDSRRFR